MLRTTLATIFVALVPLAAAQADGHHPHHQPPQEALDACKSAKRGDACSVTLHAHTLAGTCEAPPDATALACRPDHPPPPPEAIAACNGAKLGDACTFAHDDDSVTGTCAKGPDGNGELACRPEHPPHH